MGTKSTENQVNIGQNQDESLLCDQVENVLCIENNNWKVMIHKETTKKIGSLVFPEVKLCIEGEKDSVETIVYQFRIEFLSAGG